MHVLQRLSGGINAVPVDVVGDGRPDAVTGRMHISRPYDRLGRVTLWTRPQ
jgi:hypothetical protein